MKVVGIRFRRAGKIYPYDPGTLELKKDMIYLLDMMIV